MFVAGEGRQLGSYRLVRRLGRGGMGEVWAAEDQRLPRAVAVRIVAPHVAADAEARARLLREARLAAQLQHPAIATVFAIEENQDAVYLVMELVEGKPLGIALRDHSLSDYDAVRIARDVASALAVAHDRGIVHRDIKPDNVMVTPDGLKVLDFGTRSERAEARMLIGTLEFMSPEQLLGKPVDARTDIFSLGTLLYQSLASRQPFRGATATEMLLAVCRDEPEPLGAIRPELPRELAGAVQKCLAKERSARYATARELAAELDALLPRLSREPRALQAAVKLPISANDSPFGGRRMLIADDDPSILRLLATLARRQGIDVDTASNGAEAIAALKANEYAVLFVDLMMPRVDGWGVLDFLRNRGKERAPKVFIVTAFLDQTVSTADREIVTGIIYKPIDAEELSRLMGIAMRGMDTAGVLVKTRHRIVA